MLHSCNPNCEFVQDGDRVLVRTLREVKKGKELTVDYGNKKKHFLRNANVKGTNVEVQSSIIKIFSSRKRQRK